MRNGYHLSTNGILAPPQDKYALVTYLPEPLGKFLTDLRHELVPGCYLRAHLTILPPRLLASGRAGWDRILRMAPQIDPIEIALGEIGVFAQTNVIHLSLARGQSEMVQLHELLAAEELAFAEQFEFHPHVTLAQGLVPEDAAVVEARARQAWAEFDGPRSFVLDSMTFVRSVTPEEWLDLGTAQLGCVRHA